MNTAVYSAARALAARAKADGHPGYCEDVATWRKLNADLGGIIPEWYITLMTSVPLVGLEFGWQSLEPKGEDDGVRIYVKSRAFRKCAQLPIPLV